MILISWEQMEKVKQVNYHEHFGEEQKPQKLNLLTGLKIYVARQLSNTTLKTFTVSSNFF